MDNIILDVVTYVGFMCWGHLITMWVMNRKSKKN